MRKLLNYFNDAIRTEEDVKRLRKKILDLAVRGKLVPQDPNHEPASALIERIDLEREKWVREKRIRKPKGLPPIRENEVPFELPESWEWVRLGKAVTIRGGSGFPKALQGELSGEYPFFKVSDLSNSVTTEVMGAENWLNRAIVKEKGYKTFPRGTIVFPKIGGALLTNNRKILGIEGLIDNNCMGVIPFLKDCRDFVFLFFFTLDMGEFASGTSVPAVSQARVSSILFPLPPIEEQKRIVAKVDELMQICNKLSSDIRQKRKRSSILNKSIFTRIQEPTNGNAYKDVEFVVDHMDALLSSKEDVYLFRKSILSLATQGKLVPQDPSDEPASTLIERIDCERERLTREKGIRRPKELPPIGEGEVPFDLPDSWEWARVGNVGRIVGGGTPKTKVGEYWAAPGQGIPWVTPADIACRERKNIDRGNRDITPLGLEKSSARLIPRGSILFSSRAPIGYVVIAENDITTNQGFRSIVPYIMESNEYIFYCMRLIGERIDKNASGTTFREVSGGNLAKELIPLPPLEEQKRIVAKVDEMMELCDGLEAKIEGVEKRGETLTVAVLNSL